MVKMTKIVLYTEILIPMLAVDLENQTETDISKRDRLEGIMMKQVEVMDTEEIVESV